ncbi:MAG: cytochrome c-type biogenesis protein [Candidatus Acidiferrales bacterium]
MIKLRGHSRQFVWAGLAAFFLLTAVLGYVLSVRAQETQRAKELGQKLLCVCGCNQILTACNHVGCTYSHGMLKELDDRVARNEPDNLTIQAFVQEYGPTVLAAPTNTGFNRAAWIMPVAVPLIALFLLWEVVRRWRQRAAAAAASAPQISPELLARAQREADKGDDEQR